MAMVPTTTTRANTWIDSTVGKAQVDWAIKAPSGVVSSHWQNGKSIVMRRGSL